MKTTLPLQTKTSMRIALALALALVAGSSISSGYASSLWGSVPGKVLGSVGAYEVVQKQPTVWEVQLKPTTLQSASGGTKLNTSRSGQGLFFGTVGNSVEISRKQRDGTEVSYKLGELNTSLLKDGGLRDGVAWLEDRWTFWVGVDGDGAKRNFSQKACDDCVWRTYPAEGDQRPYALGKEGNFRPHKRVNQVGPSHLLVQNSVVMRVYKCYPHGGPGLQPLFAGQTTGADWHIDPNPVINAVGDFGDNPVHWEMTGHWQGVVEVTPGPGARGKSYNNVTMVDATAMLPCETMKDFYLP